MYKLPGTGLPMHQNHIHARKKMESRQVCEHLQSPEHRHLSTEITPVHKC